MQSDRERAVARAWHHKNKERRNAERRARYKANPAKYIAQAQAHYAKNSEHIKLREQLRRYGMTKEQLAAMKQAQNCQCAICSRVMTSPHIDHDHDTGKVRALLCAQCNTAIGLLGDSSRTAFNAASYLQSHGK